MDAASLLSMANAPQMLQGSVEPAVPASGAAGEGFGELLSVIWPGVAPPLEDAAGDGNMPGPEPQDGDDAGPTALSLILQHGVPGVLPREPLSSPAAAPDPGVHARIPDAQGAVPQSGHAGAVGVSSDRTLEWRGEAFSVPTEVSKPIPPDAAWVRLPASPAEAPLSVGAGGIELARSGAPADEIVGQAPPGSPAVSPDGDTASTVPPQAHSEAPASSDAAAQLTPRDRPVLSRISETPAPVAVAPAPTEPALDSRAEAGRSPTAPEATPARGEPAATRVLHPATETADSQSGTIRHPSGQDFLRSIDAVQNAGTVVEVATAEDPLIVRGKPARDRDVDHNAPGPVRLLSDSLEPARRALNTPGHPGQPAGVTHGVLADSVVAPAERAVGRSVANGLEAPSAESSKPVTEPLSLGLQMPHADTDPTAAIPDAQGPLPAAAASEAARIAGPAGPAEPAAALEPSRTDGSGHVRALDQVVKAVDLTVRQGVRELTVRMDPPGLGTLHVRVSQTVDGLTAQVRADTPEVHRMIWANQSDLRESLQQSGVRVEQVSVPDFGTGFGSAGQGGAGRQWQDSQAHRPYQAFFAQAEAGASGRNDVPGQIAPTPSRALVDRFA